MKRINKILALTAATAAVAVSLSSCNTVWEASVDASPYDYYYGWDGEWIPSLAGAPLVSPYYYGGTAFPVSGWQPVYRPGTGPWGGPAAPPVVNVPNRPSGNVRPPQKPTEHQGTQLPPAKPGMQNTHTSNGRH